MFKAPLRYQKIAMICCFFAEGPAGDLEAIWYVEKAPFVAFLLQIATWHFTICGFWSLPICDATSSEELGPEVALLPAHSTNYDCDEVIQLPLTENCCNTDSLWGNYSPLELFKLRRRFYMILIGFDALWNRAYLFFNH